MKLTAFIKNGSPVWDYPSERVRVFQELEGKRVVVEVKRESNNRTAKQNAFLWGPCYGALLDRLRFLGYDTIEVEIAGESVEIPLTKEILHEHCKKLFLQEIDEETGEIRTMSSSELQVHEFFDRFVERIQKYAAEKYGCFIPDPVGVTV